MRLGTQPASNVVDGYGFFGSWVRKSVSVGLAAITLRGMRISLLFGLMLVVAGCDVAPSGPAVVHAIVVDGGEPVAGAIVQLRLLNDSSATATTDSAGRVRVELAAAEGAGLVEVIRDTARPGPRVFAPVLLAPGDSARLRLDLAGERGHQARYVSDTRMARWGRAAQVLYGIEADHYVAYQEWVRAGQPGDLEVDFRGAVDSVRTWLETEDDPEVRGALWLAVLTAGPRGDSVTVAEAELALNEIEAGAAIWAYRPQSVASMIGYAANVAEGVAPRAATMDGQGGAGGRALADRRVGAYLDRVIEAYPDTLVQPAVLLHAMRLADRAGRSDDAVVYYDRLVRDHPESWAAESARKERPGSRLMVGSRVPDVPLPALDSTAPPIAPADLAGPATLVDFWAAWCTPCVAEMPVIHDAYERFRDRGFDVVSVSFDAYREDVHRFRESYPMPWRHSFVGAGALHDGELATAWGVNGLPSAFLVGPDGTIIALEGELRGERLMQTLERVLGQ